MSFYGSIAGDELFDLVKKSDQFARLDKELFGSPLHLRVMHSAATHRGRQGHRPALGDLHRRHARPDCPR